MTEMLEYDENGNLNTKRNWDIHHSIYQGSLNYPHKFKFISQELLKYEQAKIIDLGCGFGHLLKQIKKDHPNFQIEGLEFSKVAVDYVNSLGINCKEGTMPADLKNYSDYDVVIATEVLEHFNEADRIEIIKNVYGMLKIGGKAIFTVPDNIMPPGTGPGQEPFHLTCFNIDSLKLFLGTVFDFSGVISRRFLVSDNPPPAGKLWGEAPFLIGTGYKK
jgi:2-polyprenyl-3-methyl-5-hydroxy-6-metoxy-1,4-benzoquinol methylase